MKLVSLLMLHIQYIDGVISSISVCMHDKPKHDMHPFVYLHNYMHTVYDHE